MKKNTKLFSKEEFEHILHNVRQGSTGIDSSLTCLDKKLVTVSDLKKYIKIRLEEFLEHIENLTVDVFNILHSELLICCKSHEVTFVKYKVYFDQEYGIHFVNEVTSDENLYDTKNLLNIIKNIFADFYEYRLNGMFYTKLIYQLKKEFKDWDIPNCADWDELGDVSKINIKTENCNNCRDLTLYVDACNSGVVLVALDINKSDNVDLIISVEYVLKNFFKTIIYI